MNDKEHPDDKSEPENSKPATAGANKADEKSKPKISKLVKEDPRMQKLQRQKEAIRQSMNARRKEIIEKQAKSLNSAKFSVIYFLLFRQNALNSLEGLKEVLSSVTVTNSNAEKTNWLELYEKYLKDEKLREAFGFSKIEEDDSEE